MNNPVVGMRVTEAEYEMIKSLTESAGMKDMSAFCKDIIRRELKEHGIQPGDNEAGTQVLMIQEGDDTETDSGIDEHGSTNSSGTEDSSQNNDITSPTYQVDPESIPVTQDRSPNWFTSHLAKLDRDCGKAQSRVDKLKSDLDLVQAVFHKTAAESLKTTLDTQDRIQTILDDATEAFHSSKEEMRTDMESLFKKMQLTFEQTASNGLRLLKDTNTALVGQIEKSQQDFSAQTEQMQQTGIALLEQHLKRSEKIAQEELQAFNKTHTLMRDDLNGTRNVIEETFKLTAEEFRSVLNPAISVLKRFKVETLKLKKAVWLSAVFTMFAVSVPAGGWLVYKYEHEKYIAEMWQRNAQRINHYIMKNFYPGLNTEGKTKINEYYSLFDLTTPEEQKGALE